MVDPAESRPLSPADRRWSVGWPAGLSGGVIVLNYLGILPPHPQMAVRDWGLHAAAVMFTAILTAQLLGLSTATKSGDARRLVLLACALPVLVFGGHETMQWFYPDGGVRDDFDSIRDYALNGVGTVGAWWSLRRCRPRRATVAVPRRRR